MSKNDHAGSLSRRRVLKFGSLGAAASIFSASLPAAAEPPVKISDGTFDEVFNVKNSAP